MCVYSVTYYKAYEQVTGTISRYHKGYLHRSFASSLYPCFASGLGPDICFVISVLVQELPGMQFSTFDTATISLPEVNCLKHLIFR